MFLTSGTISHVGCSIGMVYSSFKNIILLKADNDAYLHGIYIASSDELSVHELTDDRRVY